MKTNNYKTETKIDILQLVENAKDAEAASDIKALEKALKPIWSDFRKNPRFDEFDEMMQADLYKLCGYFLIHYGHTKGIKHYQERGKDLTSKAIRLFEKLGAIHLANRSRVSLAVAYYHEGQVDETEIILNEAALHYENNQLHPVYLKICLNKISAFHWTKNYQESVKILEEIKIPMSLCEDQGLSAQYNNQAGMILSRIGKYEEAQRHYNAAIQNVNEIENLRLKGLYLNNFAYSYKLSGNYKDALRYANNSLDIFYEMGASGYIAIVLDTKAQILLCQDKLDLALDTINEAIPIFRESDNFISLADALWLKIHILLRMDRKEKAFMQFADLTELASREIGRYAVKKFAQELSNIVYIKREVSLNDETRFFKRQMLKDAVVEADGDLEKAAAKLKISREQLAKILGNQFSGIYEDLGLRYSL